MFDVAPSELLVVAVVALLVIGPKDLPKAMRFVGYWVGKARGIARQFRSGFDTMIRESEIAELEKQWAAENERILREHPQTPQTPMTGLPAPAEKDDGSGVKQITLAPADPEPVDAVPLDPEDAPPLMTERPVIRDREPGPAETKPE